MERIAMDEATAHLSEIVDRVRMTGRPVTLTNRGEPYADLVPHRPAPARPSKADVLAALNAAGPLPKLGTEAVRASVAEGRR